MVFPITDLCLGPALRFPKICLEIAPGDHGVQESPLVGSSIKADFTLLHFDVSALP